MRKEVSYRDDGTDAILGLVIFSPDLEESHSSLLLGSLTVLTNPIPRPVQNIGEIQVWE